MTLFFLQQQRNIFIREENIRCAFDYFDLDGKSEVRTLVVLVPPPAAFASGFVEIPICVGATQRVVYCESCLPLI